MPNNTQNNGEFPLPPNWGMATDFDGKIYFIDHINKETTWLDPRDRSVFLHIFLLYDLLFLVGSLSEVFWYDLSEDQINCNRR